MGLNKFCIRILGFLEKFCHKFQRLTGLTNFWWAKSTLVVGCLYSTAWLLKLIFYPSAYEETLSSWFYVLPLMLITAELFILIDQSKNYEILESYYAEGESTAHPLTLAWREFVLDNMKFLPLEIIFIWIWIIHMNIFSILMAAAMISWHFCYFFRSLIPLPYGKSKIRELVESFVNGFKKLAPAGSR